MAFEPLSANPACNPACRVCHYKDLDYPTQLGRKNEWARRQLGHWSPALREIVAAPTEDRTGYRAKSWMRAFVRDGEVSFGMLRAVQIDGIWKKEFISWDGCPIHQPEIVESVRRLARALSRSGLRFATESLFGVWVGTPHLVLVAKDPLPPEMGSIDWNAVLASPIDRAWYHRTNQVGRKVFGRGDIVPLHGPAQTASHPIRAFRQIARSLLAQARKLAVAALLETEPAFVLDLYCGTGELAALLPKNVGWIGIEMAQEAVAYADALRPKDEGHPIHLALVGTVEHRLGDARVRSRITGKYAIYVNPPRSGIGEEARDRLLAIVREDPPTSIVYLSCSASSLARDLEAFAKAGYVPELLQPFDFFPQTEHFETLAVLKPLNR